MSERSESKAERAIRTLRECADALDALPTGRRFNALFGVYFVDTSTLRGEADHIQGLIDTYGVINEPSDA